MHRPHHQNLGCNRSQANVFLNNGVMPPHTTNIANHSDALTWLFSMQLDRNPLMSHLRNSICNQANNIYLDDRKLSPLCLAPCLEYHQTVTVLTVNGARLLTLG